METFITLQSDEALVEIEVPAGETRYRIIPRLLEQEFVFRLTRPGSRLTLTGTVTARGDEEPALRTRVEHLAPDTQATTLVKTLALDNSYPHYEGLIKIAKNAQHSQSYLTHHALLLGEKAKNWSIPSLEIEANEVKCSHSATVKTITELDLFYLKSRGLSTVEATDLLVEAFLSDTDL